MNTPELQPTWRDASAASMLPGLGQDIASETPRLLWRADGVELRNVRQLERDVKLYLDAELFTNGWHDERANPRGSDLK